MANPQLEDGHSDIANELLEVIIKTHFSSAEHSVFWAVVRKTYGWHKKTDRISFSQFEELTNMNRWHIAPALQRLINRNIIIRSGQGYALEYGVNKNYETWNSLPKSVTNIITKNSNDSLPKSVTIDVDESLPILEKSLPILEKVITENGNEFITEIGKHKNKKQYTKATTKTKEILELPEWLDKDSWDSFLEMRLKLRAAPTERAKKLLILELDKLRLAGHDPTKVLNQSIMHSWKGLFPLKDGNHNGINKPNPGKLPTTYETPEEFRTRKARERQGGLSPGGTVVGAG